MYFGPFGKTFVQGKEFYFRSLDQTGKEEVVQSNVVKLQSMGIQPTDVQALDLQLNQQFTSTILVREQAIILNLLKFQIIIFHDKIYVPHTEPSSGVVELIQKFIQGSYTHRSNGQVVQQSLGQELKHDSFMLKILQFCFEEIGYDVGKQVEKIELFVSRALKAIKKSRTQGSIEFLKRVKGQLIRINTLLETIREAAQNVLDDEQDIYQLNLFALDNEPDNSQNPYSEQMQQEGFILMESFYNMIDYKYDVIQDQKEYIEDVEQLVSIDMDAFRNNIVQVDMIMTLVTTYFTIITSVCGVFGQNMDNATNQDTTTFPITLGLSIGLSTLVLIAIFTWLKLQGMLILTINFFKRQDLQIKNEKQQLEEQMLLQPPKGKFSL